MACEVEQSYSSINFIENATKLHLRALESWKRGIHALNERLISMQIERDTLREQLEAMHAGYKKQLQLKVMKINELQSTITDISKKLDLKSSGHVKEEDVDSNDMENGASLHEEGYDDPYTSDDQSPELSHGEYGDVYLDTGTDDDTPSVVKQRTPNHPEDSRGIEGSCTLDRHLYRKRRTASEQEVPREENQDAQKEETAPHQSESSVEFRDHGGQALSANASEEGETAATVTETMTGGPEGLSEEPVVVTVLPDDHGRASYMESEESDPLVREESDDQPGADKSKESDRHGKKGFDEITSEEPMGLNVDNELPQASGERDIRPEKTHQAVREAAHVGNRGSLLLSKPYARWNMSTPYGHSVKRSVSESELTTDQNFKLPRLQPSVPMINRSCIPFKGPSRRHILSRSNSYSFSQHPKHSSMYESSFVPTMSDVSFQNSTSSGDIGSAGCSSGPAVHNSESQSQNVKSESKPGLGGNSISQLASFYQKEFDISKQYKCDFCGSKYTKLASLRRHLRAHTGIKPYKCMSCFKEFTRRDVLKIHMERHKVQNQYGCYICGLKFAYVKDLREHGLNQHKEYMSVFKESLPPEKD